MDIDDGYCTYQNQNISDSAKSDQNSLRKAIRDRNVGVVRNFIACGIEVNGHPMNILYHRPLHLAVISRSLEIVEILLKGGASIDLKSYDGETPLTLAARLGNVAVIDLLLSYTTKNTEDDHNNLSHLHIACMRNNVNIVSKLLLMTQGKDINKPVKKDSLCWPGYTPLHLAVQYGCLETVELLLNCGADIKVEDKRQMTPLHLAHLHRHEEIIDLILVESKYEHKNPTDACGLSHFHIACTRDKPLVIKHFLRSGVDVNLLVESSFWAGWRPIHFAMYYECPNAVETLLKFKAKLSGFDFSGLLKWVFRMGDKPMYELITTKKIGVVQACQGNDNLSIFLQACIQNDAEKIVELLSYGKICAPLDFNAPIWTGCTSLHIAVRYNSAAVVKYLLDHGADFMIQDGEGRTSLHIAFQYEHHTIVHNISETLDNFCQNLTDASGLSTFHILCSTNNLEAIKSLISQGTDINAQVSSNSLCWAGFTALHFAAKFHQTKVVALLLKSGADILISNLMNMNAIEVLTDRLDDQFCNERSERKISKILITIFSSLPENIKESCYKAISPLHALCINKATSPTELHQYMILHGDQLNKLIDLPSSSKFHKCTALHLAMQRDHFEQAKLLIEKGADLSIVNNNGKDPLESAASEFKFDTDTHNYESLFSLRAPIENFKPSHFHLACTVGLTNVVKYVLSRATDQKLKMRFINSVDDSGRTPLLSLLAANKRVNDIPKQEITHLLLENGANVNARDFELITSLHWASYPEDFDVVRTLVSYGANVNAQDVYGRTPLHAVFFASLIGNNDNDKIIILLLDSGADINLVNEQGLTCLFKKFRERRNDNLKDSVVPLLKHIKKLEVIGFSINDVNKKAYAKYSEEFQESFDEGAFVDQCGKELESMIRVKVDSCTTLHDIIFKRPNQMVFHCNNFVLQTLVSSTEIHENYPIYGFLIRLKVKNGKTREPLLQKFEKSFMIMSRRSLPSVFFETISQYLSNTDLENIILSTRDLNERDDELEY